MFLTSFWDDLFAGAIDISMTVLFLGIGVLALVVLLIASLVDGLFDWLEAGDGPLSVVSISLFVTIFGFTAGITQAVSGNTTMSLIIGVLCGLSTAAIAFFMSKNLKSDESSASVSMESLKGKTGITTVRISEGLYGEVSLTIQGMPQRFSAKAQEDIEPGEKVSITEVLSENSVLVEKYTSETTE